MRRADLHRICEGARRLKAQRREAAFYFAGLQVTRSASTRSDAAGTPDNGVDFVAFSEEKFGEIGAILAGDAGDECDACLGVQASLSNSDWTRRSIICSNGTEFSQPSKR